MSAEKPSNDSVTTSKQKNEQAAPLPSDVSGTSAASAPVAPTSGPRKATKKIATAASSGQAPLPSSNADESKIAEPVAPPIAPPSIGGQKKKKQPRSHLDELEITTIAAKKLIAENRLKKMIGMSTHWLSALRIEEVKREKLLSNMNKAWEMVDNPRIIQTKDIEMKLTEYSQKLKGGKVSNADTDSKSSGSNNDANSANSARDANIIIEHLSFDGNNVNKKERAEVLNKLSRFVDQLPTTWFFSNLVLLNDYEFIVMQVKNPQVIETMKRLVMDLSGNNNNDNLSDEKKEEFKDDNYMTGIYKYNCDLNDWSLLILLSEDNAYEMNFSSLSYYYKKGKNMIERDRIDKERKNNTIYAGFCSPNFGQEAIDSGHLFTYYGMQLNVDEKYQIMGDNSLEHWSWMKKSCTNAVINDELHVFWGRNNTSHLKVTKMKQSSNKSKQKEKEKGKEKGNENMNDQPQQTGNEKEKETETETETEKEADKEKEKLENGNDGIYDWKTLHSFDEIAKTADRGRFNHGMVYNSFEDYFLLFGGFNDNKDKENNSRTDEIWKISRYTYGKQEFKYEKLDLKMPDKMQSFGCLITMDNRYVLIIGGSDSNGLTDKIYVLSLLTMTWYLSKVRCPFDKVPSNNVIITKAKKDEQLVDGYIREKTKECNVTMINDLNKIIQMYHGIQYLHIFIPHLFHVKAKLEHILQFEPEQE